MSYRHCIGPYIKSTIPLFYESVDKCANHNVPENAKFCPECGLNVKFRCYEAKADNVSDWLNKFSNLQLGSFYEHFWLVDQPATLTHRTYVYFPAGKYWNKLDVIDLDAYRHISYHGADIDGIVAAFKRLFADEIKFLQQFSEVEVDFGYVSFLGV